MNILLVAHERNLGGASKSLVTLADELQRRGHKAIVIVPFKSGQVYAKLKELQIPVYKIFFGWWMMPSYWNPFLKAAFRFLYATERIPASKIARVARREQIQVIHSNSSAIDVGAVAAKLAKLPHVWHFREFGDMDYQLEYLKGRKKSCRFVSDMEGKAVFISRNLREYYKEEIPDRKCEVIYNGIAEDFLCPKEYVGNRPKTIFLISGNLHRNKGQNLALQAAKILREKGVEDFELWIAGQASAMSDSKKFEEELKAFSERHLQGICKFLGFVSDMKEVRQRADIELVCSNREAFGRVTIEAMMSGNPVLATDTGANPELIEDRQNGRLFKNGNAGDLAEKMQWFMENPECVERCGKAAYDFAKNRFLSCYNTASIEELYKEIGIGK